MVQSRPKLCSILSEYCSNVYFQPPTGTLLKYPCIIYSLSKIESKHADNNPYILSSKYDLKYITRDPDDETRYALAKLMLCRFDRAYQSDNLHHYVYTLYY